jgi:NADH dehydrogenase
VILVVGGTGTLGRLVAGDLLAAGEAVRVMTRSPESASALRDAGAEIVAGDLTDSQSLRQACAGAEQVVAAAHSLLGRGRYASTKVDLRGHCELIDAARSGGVRHFVYTSAYFADPAFDAIPFVRIKHQVEQHLRASGLSHTILRPTAFMDFHAHVLLGKPVTEGKKVVIFGRGEQPRNFVAARDVAQFAARALKEESLAGQIIDIGGPQNLSNLDVVRIYEAASGRPAKVMRVPASVPRLLSRVIRPMHSGFAQMLQLAALADTADQRFDAGALEERFAIRMTRLEDWVRTHAS